MFNLFKKKKSSGVFVPSGDNFREVTEKIEETSLNGISIHLGYHPDQLRFYFGQYDTEFDIQQVAFEIFTDRIVFVLTKSSANSVDRKKLKHFLKDFKLEDEYDSITVRDILQSGVENKSLGIEFLTRVLNLDKGETDGGIIFSKRLGLILYFANGYLTDFQSGDGLNEWTKYLKDLNENLFDSYVKVAQKYWGVNRKMCINPL